MAKTTAAASAPRKKVRTADAGVAGPAPLAGEVLLRALVMRMDRAALEALVCAKALSGEPALRRIQLRQRPHCVTMGVLACACACVVSTGDACAGHIVTW
jgi:hypothetical protein